MEAFLKADKNIDVLYAHNDQMALGAIQAIKEAGLKPGKDIIIVGVDAVKGAFEAMVAGEMNASIECSPLLGPQAVQAVRDLRAGKTLPARIWTIEGIFDQTQCRGSTAEPPVLISKITAPDSEHAGPPRPLGWSCLQIGSCRHPARGGS